MIGCLCNFLLTLVFLPHLPLRPAEAIWMTYNFFSLTVFWLLFGTLKGPNGFLAFLVPRLGPKNFGKSPKSIEKSPLPISCFWLNFRTRTARNSIKGSKNAYSALQSKNTASQNIGAWDRFMTSSNQPKIMPCHDPICPKPPKQLKNFFYSKLHNVTSHYRVWTAL